VSPRQVRGALEEALEKYLGFEVSVPQASKVCPTQTDRSECVESRAGTAGLQYPYLPMLEPVVRAVVDQNSFALIETARLEWINLKPAGPEEVASEFFRWQDPQHVAAASRSCPGGR